MTEDYAKLKEELDDLREMYFDDLKVISRMIQKLHWRLHALDGVDYDEAFDTEGEDD